MTSYRIRVEGPPTQTLDLATALADAAGVDLVGSEQPVSVGELAVALDVTVEGAFDAVADAVAGIRAGLPDGASIEIVEG